jgi:CHAD domain-containing protein
MRLDGELLDGPAATGARVLALARLADAEETALQVGAAEAPEGLHDFRVALRRLRSTLRLLDPALAGAVGAKQPRRLRKVTRLTGPAREAEVLLAWLAEVRGQLAAPYRGALDWLLDRVERRRAGAVRRVQEEALPAFQRLAPRLTRRLSAPPSTPGDAPATFAVVLAGVLRAQVLALREALGAVVGGEDAAGLHRARIEAKRLRYLLEPLRRMEGTGAEAAVEALKGLQELLGAWHDRHQARTVFAAALVEAAADRTRRGRDAGSGDLRPGLLALDQLAAREAEALYATLAERYLAGRATAVLDLAYATAAALDAPAGEAPDEPPPGERRLLLAGLPAEVSGGAIEEVAQGWLPIAGEHVGTVRSAAGERFFHVRAGGRAATLEVIGRADYEAWWPLTEGRRLHHRSHRLASLPGWRFDEFTDRKLVLAVVEPGGDPVPPPWLEPLLVREVTGERGYRDEALARRAAKRATA